MDNKVYAIDKEAYETNITLIGENNNSAGILPSFCSKALNACITFDESGSENLKKADEEMAKAYNNYTRLHRMNYEDCYTEQRQFYDMKSLMQNDWLFSVIQSMPKGGLFHVHSAAGLSFDRLMELCREWNQKSGNATDKSIHVVLSEIPGKMDQYTLKYKYQLSKSEQNGMVPISQPIEKFLEEDAANWGKLKEAICILDGNTPVKDIWKKFGRCYARFMSLMDIKEFFFAYYVAFFKECRENRIRFVDIRLGFQKFDSIIDMKMSRSLAHRIQNQNNFSLDHYLYYRDMALELPEKGQLEKEDIEFLVQVKIAAAKIGIDVRVILTANRNIDVSIAEGEENIKHKLDAAIAIAKNTLPKTIIVRDELKEMVVGFDFVNQEDRGFSTDSYADMIYGNTEVEGLTGSSRISLIDFYLHDGESCWKMAPNMKNSVHPSIIEACMVSKYRIGHGLTMTQYPELINAIHNGVKSSSADEPPYLRLPILEISPISNQLLKYYPDLRLHPLPQLMKNGINCVLSNDDPLILDNPGLSYDFWISSMDMELTYDMVKKLVFVTYAFWYIRENTKEETPLEETEVLNKAKTEFAKDWATFLKVQEEFRITLHH